MANAENRAGQVIQAIHDRFRVDQIARNILGQPQSTEERLLAAILGPNEIPRSESPKTIISPDQMQGLMNSVDNVRNLVMQQAPPYSEEPSSRVEDEEGWAYNQNGFSITVDDVTKPTSKATYFTLSIVENSPYAPNPEIWFGVTDDNRYFLTVKFLEGVEDDQEHRTQTHQTNNQHFENMPEDEAEVIEDLLKRVTALFTE